MEGSEYMEPLEEDVKTEEEAREDPEGPRKYVHNRLPTRGPAVRPQSARGPTVGP